ncbi:hypothetical protein [Sporocytophaga myxococcoides]|nr:hypothetical protein [Sporocytophaga myxococcoides]
MKTGKPEPRYSTKAAIDSLINKFGWTCKDWMQDWPLEISNEIDINICLKEYGQITDEDEKFVLMEAILYALDEFENKKNFENIADQVRDLLNQDFEIHKYTIYKWTLYESEIEEFRITPLLRRIWDEK